jgi:hypothetical protein
MFTLTFATQPWIGERRATLREMLSAVSAVGSTPMSRSCSRRERKVTVCVLSLIDVGLNLTQGIKDGHLTLALEVIGCMRDASGIDLLELHGRLDFRDQWAIRMNTPPSGPTAQRSAGSGGQNSDFAHEADHWLPAHGP